MSSLPYFCDMEIIIKRPSIKFTEGRKIEGTFFQHPIYGEMLDRTFDEERFYHLKNCVLAVNAAKMLGIDEKISDELLKPNSCGMAYVSASYNDIPLDFQFNEFVTGRSPFERRFEWKPAEYACGFSLRCGESRIEKGEHNGRYGEKFVCSIQDSLNGESSEIAKFFSDIVEITASDFKKLPKMEPKRV